MAAKVEKSRIELLKDLIIQLFPQLRVTPSFLANILRDFITQSKRHVTRTVHIEKLEHVLPTLCHGVNAIYAQLTLGP